MSAVLVAILIVLIAEGIWAARLRRRVDEIERRDGTLRERMRIARRELLRMINDARVETLNMRGISPVRIRFLPMDEEVVVMHPGLTMLQTAWENGICVPAACLGDARCGTCKVKVMEGPDGSKQSAGLEKITLSMFSAEADMRLSCCVRPRQDMTVRIEPEQERYDTVLPMD